MSEYSDQEIDLRPYIEAVLDKWYWILGLSLLAGVLAYGATALLKTPIYEATALVSITEPRQRVQFDPRIISVEENQPIRAYPEIAISDELLATLQLQVPEANLFSLQQLRSILKATPGSDPSLLRLTASNSDPEIAASIANGWAELFVTWANNTYGDSSAEQLVFFEQRLNDAAAELQEADQALIEYQAQNRSVILENKLGALEQTHSDLLAKQGEIRLLFQDIESLLALPQEELADSPGISDEFTALILKLRAFGGPSSEAVTTFPWQLQISTGMLETDNREDFEEQIRNLQASLELQAEQIEISIAEIEPQILAVQKEKQEANAMEALMLRNVEVAADTHTALARTVEEKRITSQDSNTGVNLASRSAVPTSPVGSGRLRNALAAAIGVVLLAILVIVLHTWWSSNETTSQESLSKTGPVDKQATVSGHGN